MAMVKKSLDELMQKRMDRKDFLKHVAIGTLVLTGASGIVKLLKPNQSNGSAYGASAYGGVKRDS